MCPGPSFPYLRNLSLNLSSSSRLWPSSSSKLSCPISSSRSRASVRLVAEARRLRSSSFSCSNSLAGGGVKGRGASEMEGPALEP